MSQSTADPQSLLLTPGAKVALVILGIALVFAAGGSAFGISAVFLLAGLSMLVAPPAKKLPFYWLIPSSLWVVWSMIPLLPGTRIFSGAWRKEAEEIYGFQILDTLSMQPWISLEHFFYSLLALSLFLYWCSQSVSSKQRHVLLRLIASSLIFFSILVAVTYFLNVRLPGWNSPTNLGPFENRNQLATVLAVTLLLFIALGLNDFKKNRWWAALWVLGIILNFTLLVINFSRAGVVLVFAGGLIWVFLNLRAYRQLGKMALAFLFFAAMLCAFVIFGGKTLQRFEPLKSPSSALILGDQGRTPIHQDTISLIQDHPFLGVGLGNFSSLFPQYRNALKSEHFVNHPESDWLWVAAETGFVGLLFLFLIALSWFFSSLAFKRSSDPLLRSICLIVGLAGLAHGLVDVPFHRLGSLIPILLVASLAVGSKAWLPCDILSRRAFQLIGMFLIIWGAISLGESLNFWSNPTSYANKRMMESEQKPSTESMAQADRALRVAPLDWKLYFWRATLHLSQRNDSAAKADFRRARFLEPISPELPLRESLLWMPVRPDLAIAAANEMLIRTRYDIGTKFSVLQTEAKRLNQTVLLKQLAQLAKDRPGCEQFYLESASDEEFHLWLDNDAKSFSLSNQYWFWSLVRGRMTDAEIVDWVETRPLWIRKHYRLFSDMRVGLGDYEKAYQLLLTYMPTAIIPNYAEIKEVNVTAWSKRLVLNPADFKSAFLLIQTELKEQNYTAAVNSSEAILEQKQVPAYFHYLLAQAWAGQASWVKAFQALREYDDLRLRKNPN